MLLASVLPARAAELAPIAPVVAAIVAAVMAATHTVSDGGRSDNSGGTDHRTAQNPTAP